LQKARHAADLLGISHLLGRGVRGLSGGEKQRVALARALVLSPKALLLDEPVSALDESTRESVCLQLKHIQRRTGTTTVHVCHNFEEARTVADRVGILRDGRLVQVGAVEDVFSHPAGPETARFLRVGNILSGTAEPSGGLAVIKVGDTPILCGTKTEGQAEFAIPSEAISVSLAPPGQDVAGSGVNVLSGAVTAVLPRGPFDQVVVRVSPELTLTAYAPRTSQRIESGKPVHLRFPAEAVHVFGR
jgi:ABC-type Fe3+/spermidine/putrescine transport system ATPase subunit